MRKNVLFFTVFSFLILVTPLGSHANSYSGAWLSEVVQPPIIGCDYAILYDNHSFYDVVEDYVGTTDDISNGDYLYGGIQYGTQFFYDSQNNKPLSLYVSDTMMDWDMAVDTYFSDCPSYN